MTGKNSDWKESRMNDMHTVILHLNNLADTMPSTDRLAMQRRVAQLTMDYIYNIIMLLIPEPATATMSLLGLTALMVRRKRK